MNDKMDKKEVASRLQEILNRNNDRKVNKLMPEDIRQLNICIAALTIPVVAGTSKCYHYNHEWQSDGDGGILKYCNDCKGYV